MLVWILGRFRTPAHRGTNPGAYADSVAWRLLPGLASVGPESWDATITKTAKVDRIHVHGLYQYP